MARSRSRKETKRKERTRVQRPYVLIVCEGEKTERCYFQDLARRHRLYGVVVVGTGSDPNALVKEARKRKQKEALRGNAYDQVYCVFDRDEHRHFDAATNQAGQNGMAVARSWPCFEYWLLLHFRYTRRPFARKGKLSPCDVCIEALRAPDCLPDYQKVLEGVLETLQDRLDTAIKHATQAELAATQEDEPNPSTEVHNLVSYLLEQASLPSE